MITYILKNLNPIILKNESIKLVNKSEYLTKADCLLVDD